MGIVYYITKNMVKKVWIICSLLLSLFFYWCSFEDQNTDNNIQDTVTNDASIYCENYWWVLEIVPDEWWERWKCNFDDWSFCEEWAYYYWKCSPGRWNGNILEIDEIQNNDEINEEFVNLVWELWEENLLITWNDADNEPIVNTCPQDEIKKCDDGTFLVREWPDCEFWNCPGYPLSDDLIQDILYKFENTWSELNENDINLMNEIIGVITQI